MKKLTLRTQKRLKRGQRDDWMSYWNVIERLTYPKRCQIVKFYKLPIFVQMPFRIEKMRLWKHLLVPGIWQGDSHNLQ